MKFFIAGVMQGSNIGLELHGQNYRDEIKDALRRAFPDADVYDPFERNQNSLLYDDETGRRVFLEHNRMCGTEVDVLVAFAPVASMGTAIEIWEAWKNDALVIAISPMTENWAIKFLCDPIYPDLDAFKTALESGEIQKLVRARKSSERRSDN